MLVGNMAGNVDAITPVKQLSSTARINNPQKNQANNAAVNQNKARDCQNEQTNTPGDDKRFTANFITQHPHEWLHEQHTDHDGNNNQYSVVFRVMQAVRQVARHIRQQHVVSDVCCNDDTHTDDQALPLFCQDLAERDFRRFSNVVTQITVDFVHVLLEGRGLFQCMTEINTDQAQRCSDEERNTPAPVEEVLFSDDAGDQDNHAGT